MDQIVGEIRQHGGVGRGPAQARHEQANGSESE